MNEVHEVDEMQQLTVNDVKISVRQNGDGDPVLLLHPGFIADGLTPLLGEPALGGYRLVAYHRRGYGRSEPISGAFTVAQQAADAVALLRTLGIARAHVVGHSYGANIALEVALTAPDVVGSLALLDPLLLFAVSPSTAQFVLDTGAAVYPQLAAGDVEAALDTWLTGAFDAGFRDTLERTLPGAFSQATADAATAFGVEVPSLQTWDRGADDIRRIDRPVLSVRGADATWPGFLETHKALLTWIDHAEGLVVPNATHLLQIANPSAVAGGLAAFLRRHPGLGPLPARTNERQSGAPGAER